MPVEEFIRPTTLKDAVALLSVKPGRSPIAGGTFLAHKTPAKIKGLVDLSHVPLNYIEKKKGTVHIGAMTTIKAISTSKKCGALAELAADISTEPLRCMITIGGNVMIPLRWSDMPLLLTLCDAEFVVQGERMRVIKAAKFFSVHPHRHLKNGEFIKEIKLGNMNKRYIARKKLLRVHDDIPALQIGVSARHVRGKLEDVRVAFVCHRPLPQRIKSVEKLIEGMKIGGEIPEKCAEKARKEAGDLHDMRYSSDYLTDVLGVYVMRLLNEISAEKKEG